MKDLNTTKAIVQSILEKDERARNSDHILYLRVLEYITEHDSSTIPLKTLTVVDFLNILTNKNCPYPVFETVRRTRQKVQAECPWLGSCEKVSEYRAENEAVFREFARS